MRLPSQQHAKYLVRTSNAFVLESNPDVRNLSEIRLRLHKLRCIPILTLHVQHELTSPLARFVLHLSRISSRPALHCGVAYLASS